MNKFSASERKNFVTCSFLKAVFALTPSLLNKDVSVFFKKKNVICAFGNVFDHQKRILRLLVSIFSCFFYSRVSSSRRLLLRSYFFLNSF